MKQINKTISDSDVENYVSMIFEKKDNKNKKSKSDKSNKTKESKPLSDDSSLKEAGIDPKDLEAQSSGLNDEQKSKSKKVLAFLAKMINSASDSLIASNLDDFTLGNFREAVCDIYKKKLDKMSEEELKNEAKTLHDSPEFAKGQKEADRASRKDDNKNTEIDESSAKYKILFYSPNEKENLLKQLENISIEIQKKAKEFTDQREKLKSEIKSKKIDGVGDPEIDAFGPMLKNLIDSGKSSEEIAKKVAEMKAGIKESYDRKIRKYTNKKLLTEGKCFITEKQKNIFLLETLFESDEFIEHLTLYMLNEGLFDKIKSFTKATGKVAAKAAKAVGKSTVSASKFVWGKVPEKYKNFVKDITDKAIEKLKDGALAPILSIAGLGLTVLTGGWTIAIVLASMTIIMRHGTFLKASFDKYWATFKNSGGVVTQMDFNIKDNPDLKYSMRYYITDQTWRVLNLKNQSKTPSLEFAKTIIGSDAGQKYIKEVQKKWDPVFNKEKGGKISFGELLAQAKDLKIDEKQVKLLDDFKGQYDKTIANMTKPQIDT